MKRQLKFITKPPKNDWQNPPFLKWWGYKSVEFCSIMNSIRSLKYGFCKKLLRYKCTLLSWLFFQIITSVSIKPGQNIVLHLYYGLSRFFSNRRYFSMYLWLRFQILEWHALINSSEWHVDFIICTYPFLNELNNIPFFDI